MNNVSSSTPYVHIPPVVENPVEAISNAGPVVQPVEPEQSQSLADKGKLGGANFLKRFFTFPAFALGNKKAMGTIVSYFAALGAAATIRKTWGNIALTKHLFQGAPSSIAYGTFKDSFVYYLQDKISEEAKSRLISPDEDEGSLKTRFTRSAIDTTIGTGLEALFAPFCYHNARVKGGKEKNIWQSIRHVPVSTTFNPLKNGSIPIIFRGLSWWGGYGLTTNLATDEHDHVCKKMTYGALGAIFGSIFPYPFERTRLIQCKDVKPDSVGKIARDYFNLFKMQGGKATVQEMYKGFLPALIAMALSGAVMAAYKDMNTQARRRNVKVEEIKEPVQQMPTYSQPIIEELDKE